MTNEELAKLYELPADAKVKLNVKEDFTPLYLRLIVVQSNLYALQDFYINNLQASTGKPRDELTKELDELILKHKRDLLSKFVAQHGA